MKNKYRIISIISLVLAIIIVIMLVTKLVIKNLNSESIKVDLTNLTYAEKKESTSIKTYNDDNYLEFLSDYSNNNLPSIYVTTFLFDGVGKYKPYDLDDFTEEGNDTSIDPLEITAININTTGDIELSGELVGGMLAINTNNIKDDINILLNNVKIDTDSKKVPVVYVYNKDITYTDNKVTIKALKDSKNYLEGGKLKKVSLLPSDNLTEYTSRYSIIDG